MLDNLNTIKKNIKNAAKEAGRNAEDIVLVAVTKTVDINKAEEIYKLGVCDLGENRVQELVRKRDIMPDGIKWHMIGRLQKNKVKYIIDSIELIHSLDSLGLAAEIEKQCVKKDIKVNVLIQINVSGEDTKTGFYPDEIDGFISEMSKLPHVMVKGLMTMAPYEGDAGPIFKKAAKIFKQLQKKAEDGSLPDNVIMEELSMGMSGDYTAAILEGATMIRLGGAIFGR